MFGGGYQIYIECCEYSNQFQGYGSGGFSGGYNSGCCEEFSSYGGFSGGYGSGCCEEFSNYGGSIGGYGGG